MDKTTSILGGLIAVLLVPVALNNWNQFGISRATDKLIAGHIAAGQEAMREARFRIAEKAFAEAQKLKPSNIESAFGLYRAQASRIVNANESLDREGAYRLLYRLEKMPERDAGHAELYRLALANIHVALNDTKAAKTELDAATGAANASSKAWGMRGAFEFRGKAFDLALTSFEKALALDEKNGSARLGLGMVYKAQKKFKQASDELARATELLGGAKSFYELGDTQLQAGSYDAAYQSLSAAAKAHPKASNDANLLSRLGVSAFKVNRFDEAVRYLAAAFKQDKKVDTALNLGIAYQKIGKHKEAAQSLSTLIKADPAHPEGHAYLMKSLVQLNQVDAARQLGRQYLARAQNRPAMQNGAALIRNVLTQLRPTAPTNRPVGAPAPPPKASPKTR